jgi:hypothetical protein
MAMRTDEAGAELAELRTQREEMHRELVRKTFRIAELEQAVYETARTYEESLSWRLTRPVRALRLLLGRVRG